MLVYRIVVTCTSLAFLSPLAAGAQHDGASSSTEPRLRRASLLHDIHNTVSDLFFPRRKRSTTTLQKRAGAVNARNQCVVVAPAENPLATLSGGGATTNTTSASASSSSSRSTSSSTSTKSGKSSQTGKATTTTSGAKATTTSPWNKKLDSVSPDFIKVGI